MSRDELLDAYGKLSSALNALAGCVMFAPSHLVLRDAKGLAEAAQQAAFEFEQALEDSGDE